MRIKEKNQIVVFLSESIAVDSMGQKIPEYLKYCRTWGKLEASAVKETEKNNVQTAKAGYILTVDFIPGITDTMRIVWNSKQFEIKEIINIKEENRILKIEMEEIKKV